MTQVDADILEKVFSSIPSIFEYESIEESEQPLIIKILIKIGKIKKKLKKNFFKIFKIKRKNKIKTNIIMKFSILN